MNFHYGSFVGLARICLTSDGYDIADTMEPLDDDEKIWVEAIAAAYDFGEQCANFRAKNGYPDTVPLEVIINHLMTELWDREFSQTEIRTAFEKAMSDMNRYAAGAERRT